MYTMLFKSHRHLPTTNVAAPLIIALIGLLLARPAPANDDAQCTHLFCPWVPIAPADCSSKGGLVLAGLNRFCKHCQYCVVDKGERPFHSTTLFAFLHFLFYFQFNAKAIHYFSVLRYKTFSHFSSSNFKLMKQCF